MGERTGRNVIITGGAGGIGTTVTSRWLEAGARVLVVSHTESSLNELREALAEEVQDRLFTFVGDVATEAGAAALVAEGEQVFGAPPDTLIHLVGGFAMGPIDAPDAAVNWTRMLHMNLDSAFYCYRAMVPVLKKRGGGWLVGLGSRVSEAPSANLAAYAVSKAGLVTLTQALAAELRDDNIHVNVLLISTADTPANRKAMGEKNAEKWVQPDDIADATLYLCSEQARAVHGATLEVYHRA